jgi:hypothetical protein
VEHPLISRVSPSQEGTIVAADEPVTSPDQRRPTVSRRLARLGLVVTILALIAMALSGNHEGRVENIFLYGTAALLTLMLVGDFALRKSGLKSD